MMKRKWIFDAYNGKSEFIERLFVVASHYEEAVEALEVYIKSKQDCWVHYVGEEQARDNDLSSGVTP